MVRRIDGTFHKKINLSLYTSHQNLISDSDKGYIVRVPSKDEVFVFSERGSILKQERCSLIRSCYSSRMTAMIGKLSDMSDVMLGYT